MDPELLYSEVLALRQAQEDLASLEGWTPAAKLSTGGRDDLSVHRRHTKRACTLGLASLIVLQHMRMVVQCFLARATKALGFKALTCLTGDWKKPCIALH